MRSFPTKDKANKPETSVVVRGEMDLQRAVDSPDGLAEFLRAHIQSIDAKRQKDGRFTSEQIITSLQVYMLTQPPEAFEKLRACSRDSLLTCAYDLAILDLVCHPLLNYCYLGVYNKQAKVGLTYQGALNLARRCIEVDGFDAGVVYKGDIFKAVKGEPLHHEIALEAKHDQGHVLGAYAIAYLKNVPPVWILCNRDDIETARACSKVGHTGAWQKHYAAMAQKTALLRLCKILPRRPESEERWIRLMEAERRSTTLASESAEDDTSLVRTIEAGKRFRQTGEDAHDKRSEEVPSEAGDGEPAETDQPSTPSPVREGRATQRRQSDWDRKKAEVRAMLCALVGPDPSEMARAFARGMAKYCKVDHFAWIDLNEVKDAVHLDVLIGRLRRSCEAKRLDWKPHLPGGPNPAPPMPDPEESME